MNKNKCNHVCDESDSTPIDNLMLCDHCCIVICNDCARAIDYVHIEQDYKGDDQEEIRSYPVCEECFEKYVLEWQKEVYLNVNL